MNKIIKCLEYLDYQKYNYHHSGIRITVFLNGDCTIIEWEEDYHTGNVENIFNRNCKVNELSNYKQEKILEDLKKLVEAKMKNKILGFDLF